MIYINHAPRLKVHSSLKPADISLSLPELADEELEEIPDSAEQGEMVILSKEELALLEKIRSGKKK